MMFKYVLANIDYYASLYGYSPRELFTKSGMGKNIWYRRRKNPQDFSLGEIKSLAGVMGIKYSRLLEERRI